MQQLFTEVWLEGRVQDIVLGMRLPRLAIGIITGGALAVAGVILQTLTHNPLASASTLGINAGAFFAVVVSTIFFPSALGQYPFIVAVIGAILSTLLVSTVLSHFSYRLIELPGVARKTANIVLYNAYGVVDGVAVDTHVRRLAQLLGLADTDNPDKIEQELMQITPKENWMKLTDVLIFHGRQVCIARKPKCEVCVLNQICPSAFSFG